jgi:AcrR family transcriptional regulator
MATGRSAAAGAQTDGRTRRWEGYRAARRAELVDAAIGAIRRQGATVAMEDIAAEAGTSKAGIYRHFADKEDLSVAVGSRIAGDLVADITAALASEHHPRRALTAAIDAYLKIIESDPEPYRFIVHRPLVDRPSTADPMADYTALVAAHAVRLIGEALQGGGLATDPAELWGHAVVGYVRAAGEWWLDHPTMPRPALTQYLTALLWHGFRGVETEAGLSA